MKITSSIIRPYFRMTTLVFVCLVGIILESCSDVDLITNDKKREDREVAVTFNVIDAQAATRASFADVPVTRATFTEQLAQQGLQYNDLVSQKLSVSGGAEDLCMIETTTPGIDNLNAEPAHTRATVVTLISGQFSSIGYRGTSADGISSTSWFHNKETNANGTLVEDIRWSWGQPYGRFYGISPRITRSNNKLTVSPETYSGTPYLNFEVEQDVNNPIMLPAS